MPCMQSRPVFEVETKPMPMNYLILNGDTPLLKEETARGLLRVHQSAKSDRDDSDGGARRPQRIWAGHSPAVRRNIIGMPTRLRPMCSRLSKIEMRPGRTAVKEINVGTYVVSGEFLFDALEKLEPQQCSG